MKKGILILTLLILALFTVSCIYAADAEDAIAISEDTAAIEVAQSDEVTASDDSQIMEQSDDEELILEDNDVDKPILGEGASTGSFTDLNDLINNQYGSNDTITLSCNYAFNGTDDDDSGFIHGIGINRGVTIDGKGCTIDGSQKARIFNIGYGGSVKFLNINFINGKATGIGWEMHGGAISAEYWNCVVESCNFTNNTAQNQGGALMRITAYNCTFTGNKAYQGGAIHDGSAYNCVFTGNKAIGDYGGAIKSGSAYNCTFTGNTANYDGGAIHDGSAYNCTFTGNKAIGDYGGAIYMGSAYNCTFTGNTAYQGGAIYMGSAYNCTFTGNTADYGGAIYWEGANGAVSGCSFINNTAAGDGSAIYWNDKYGSVSDCIFLNNTAGSWEVIYADGGDLNMNHCWFGNTADNYDSSPAIGWDYSCDNWLFLNATANPNEVPAFSTSEIVFKLYLYNKTSTTGNISEYDNTLLLPINLTITSTNGDVDIHTVDLGDSIRYTATSRGTGSITASIENVKYTIETTNLGLNPDLSVDSQEADYSNSTIIAINYNSSATGTVNITLKGKNGNNYTFTNLALNATILLPEAINADEYAVNVAYSGDNAFLNATATGTLTVNKANSTLTINDNVTFDYNTNGSTTVSYTNASGVNASVVGQPNAIVVVNDTTITVSGLNAGNYTLTVTTITDSNHNNITRNATITVNKAKTQLTANAITTTYNINKDLIITLKDSNGNPVSGAKLIVDLNGAKTYTTDKNGQVKVSTKGLAPKAYTAKVTFNGNTNYDKSTKDIKVTVNKATPKITAKAKTFKTTTKTKKYAIVLKNNVNKPISKATVYLKVGGKTYKATTNSKGKATFKITNLNKKGTFKATVTYKGNKYYNKVSKKAKIKVIVTFKTVSKGSKDKATVKEIQQALKYHGYYLSYKGHYLMVDGKFESCTERSVKEFQHDKGLKVTGKVDEKTAKKLGIIK